ncbi:MAG TPA: NfeD family protein, partial [Orrella sp.]
AIIASLFILRYLPKTRVGRHLVLSTGLTAESGFTSEPLEEHNLVGKTGAAVSTLRPSGIASIDGKRIDVVSDGEFIEPGESIRVDHVDGNRVVVRRIVNPETSTSGEQ